jgi:hypothetical protein
VDPSCSKENEVPEEIDLTHLLEALFAFEQRWGCVCVSGLSLGFGDRTTSFYLVGLAEHRLLFMVLVLVQTVKMVQTRRRVFWRDI